MCSDHNGLKLQINLKKQTEMPENQTAWNSDNQGIKKIINQNNQTGVPRQRNWPK